MYRLVIGSLVCVAVGGLLTMLYLISLSANVLSEFVCVCTCAVVCVCDLWESLPFVFVCSGPIALSTIE